MDIGKIIGALGGILDKLSALDSILFILLIVESAAFYFTIKVLFDALSASQNNRIEENKKMIQVQESTTTALNNLSKVVEVGFNLISSLGKK